MSHFQIDVDGGKTVRLPTAGKVCDRDIFVTGKGGDTNAAYEEGYNKATAENPLYYATKLDNTWGGAGFPQDYEAVLRFKKAPTSFNYAFNNAWYLKSIRLTSEDKSNVVSFAYFASIADEKNATLEIVDLTDFNTKFSSIQNAFRNQLKLKSILGVLDLSGCTSASSINAYSFWYCSALEDIEFVPNTIMLSLPMSFSSMLTDKSIQSIIDGLADLTGATAQTITFHKDVGNKLTDAQKTAISAKNWTLAY